MKPLFTAALFMLCSAGLYAQQFDSPTKVQHLSHKRLERAGDQQNQQLPYDESLKPFYHGVASGDPLSDRVIIWTRVTPDRNGPVNVRYLVAKDPSFQPSSIVKRGHLLTDADRDYTVKVDVDGLEPATTYYYLFSAGNANSLVGRTRTAPAHAEADQLRFAVVSCSNYQAGYFNAYQAIARRGDLDAVIHLGDYIYEYGGGEGTYGYSPDRPDRVNVPDTEILTLADYRTRYSLYRLDPDLRAAHQQHPFLPIWDDHESANDAYEHGAENHNEGEGSWEERKAISKKVYFEWMPIRDQVENKLYRTIRYGNLADIMMVDTRLEARDQQINDITNLALYSPTRTLLGQTQKQWLLNQLQASTARWKVLANQVIFSEFHVGWAASAQQGQSPQALESQFLDIWDGYPAERNSLIDALATQNINNVIILTGDFHSTFAFDVAKFPSPFSLQDPLNAAKTLGYDPATGNGSVAVEFATPSISSANFDENLAAAAGSAAAGKALSDAFEKQINNPLPAPYNLNPNPHMKYVDLDQHGYFIMDLKEDRAQADWFFMHTILEKNTSESFGRGLYTADGTQRLQFAEGAAPAKEEQPALAPAQPFRKFVEEDEKEKGTVFGVYPNPVEKGKMLYINYGLVAGGQLTISLRKMNGDVVASLPAQQLSAGNHTMTYQLPADLKKGIYLLYFETASGSFSHRIVVR
ncbi:alkaline phosphatase D family protein [Cesiribacter sp. SM1]|uniref:alkaline phosphatase D family protein n=1 Tax=Cesiribacter sp. SM1 TaxID=2861196 RepID=UPI001CD7BDB9|nr:alkaline phosphatase D family protein [Cesiribacter sp. SM1]